MTVTSDLPSPLPLSVRGQLAIRIISGRNGPFRVGRLITHFGEFEIKDPELEQYPEGKYDGEFLIRYIFLRSFPVGGNIRCEIRASLYGMTLNGADILNHDEAGRFATQDIDPIDEESEAPPATTLARPIKASRSTTPTTAQASDDPLVDTTPFGVDTLSATAGDTGTGDPALFGILWPLGESVKLDPTIDRRTLRSQIARLGELGYTLDFTTQAWTHVVAS